MRYRKLINGDYAFGQVATPNPEFWVNQPEGVAQAVQTRLNLLAGEWFLNNQTGTPFNTSILGKGTLPLYDAAIKARIANTIGVSAITAYSSSFNSVSRSIVVNVTILTSYSQQTVSVSASLGGSSQLANTKLDPYGNIVIVQPLPSTPSAPGQ